MSATLKSILRRPWHRFQRAVYFCTGRKPWAFGYGVHKRLEITRAITNDAFAEAALPPGHGRRLDERVVEYPWFFSRLPKGAGALLDAGSVLNHSFLLDHPRMQAKRLFISTLAPESESFNARAVSYVYEDLRQSCFRDGYFDWIVSLSTVEHIGLDNAMLYSGDAAHREENPGSYLDAIREFRRMLRPGGTLFLSVPFGRHRNHGWFQVFDASMVDTLVAAFGPTRSIETIYQYFPDGWRASDRLAARDATFFDIHERRVPDPDGAAGSRAVVCLELRA